MPSWSSAYRRSSDLQSSEDDQEQLTNRSRLLSSLDQDQLQDLAYLTVTFGVVLRKDGLPGSGRSAMPLQPELLQALLWQGMRLRLDLPSLNLVSQSLQILCIVWLRVHTDSQTRGTTCAEDACGWAHPASTDRR